MRRQVGFRRKPTSKEAAALANLEARERRLLAISAELGKLERLCRARPPLSIAGPIADCLLRLDLIRAQDLGDDDDDAAEST
jgi:hypothetical protein